MTVWDDGGRVTIEPFSSIEGVVKAALDIALDEARTMARAAFTAEADCIATEIFENLRIAFCDTKAGLAIRVADEFGLYSKSVLVTALIDDLRDWDNGDDAVAYVREQLAALAKGG